MELMYDDSCRMNSSQYSHNNIDDKPFVYCYNDCLSKMLCLGGVLKDKAIAFGENNI